MLNFVEFGNILHYTKNEQNQHGISQWRLLNLVYWTLATEWLDGCKCPFKGLLWAISKSLIEYYQVSLHIRPLQLVLKKSYFSPKAWPFCSDWNFPRIDDSIHSKPVLKDWYLKLLVLVTGLCLISNEKN